MVPAAVLKRGKGNNFRKTGSDGNGLKTWIPAVLLRISFITLEITKAILFFMNGREIFKFAVKVIPECIEKVLENTGYSQKEVKHIIPHQANVRILDAQRKSLQIVKQILCQYPYVRNTSRASIPCFDEMSRGGCLTGDLIILVGFGQDLLMVLNL
jgi:3-oxoacyl-[acyl-carrier-protein] synthase-3